MNVYVFDMNDAREHICVLQIIIMDDNDDDDEHFVCIQNFRLKMSMLSSRIFFL